MFDALKKYAVIEGRANRREFWLFYLLVLLSVICALILTAISAALGAESGGVGIFLFGILFLFYIIPSIALGFRRVQDFDSNGWLYLTTFIPWMGFFLWVFIGVVPGSKGKNKYGAVPKG